MKITLQKVLLAVAVLWLSMVLPVAAMEASVAASGQKIVVGAGVRVRNAPSVSGKEVGKLTLGSVVDVSQRSKEKAKVGSNTAYWYQISSPVSGWVFGGFTQDFDTAHPDAAWLELTRAKLGKEDKVLTGDALPLGFSDAVELAAFAKTAAAKSTDPETQGEMALARLRAMQVAAYALPMEQEKRAAEPYASWLKAQGDQVFADEVSGSYLVPAANFWKLADKYKNAAIGDAIAFHAANAALGGECEGFMSCYSVASQRSEGEYLKRFPKGKYVEPALAMVKTTLDALQADWDSQRDERAETNLAGWEAILKPVEGKTAEQLRKQLNRLKVQ